MIPVVGILKDKLEVDLVDILNALFLQVIADQIQAGIEALALLDEVKRQNVKQLSVDLGIHDADIAVVLGFVVNMDLEGDKIILDLKALIGDLDVLLVEDNARFALCGGLNGFDRLSGRRGLFGRLLGGSGFLGGLFGGLRGGRCLGNGSGSLGLGLFVLEIVKELLRFVLDSGDVAVLNLDVRAEQTLFVDGAVDNGELTLADVLDLALVLELELIEREVLFALAEDEIQGGVADVLDLSGGDDLLALVLVGVVVERDVADLLIALGDDVVT